MTEFSNISRSEISKSITERDAITINFFLSNATGYPISDATIQAWWNGIDTSSSVNNLGYGNYSINLTPIIISSGDYSILFNMTISADGFEEKYFETYIPMTPTSPTDKNISGYGIILFYGVILSSIIIIYSRLKRKSKE